MPFSVLKIPKGVDGLTEVAGEFPEEQDAHNLVEELRTGDLNEEHDFVVEPPPSTIH